MKPSLAYTDTYCSIDDFLVSILSIDNFTDALGSLRLNGYPLTPLEQARLVEMFADNVASVVGGSLYDVLSSLRGRALDMDGVVIDFVEPGLSTWFAMLSFEANCLPTDELWQTIGRFFANLRLAYDERLDPAVREVAEQLMKDGCWETLDDILPAARGVAGQ